MVVIITGASHTGKTFLAQKLLEKYGYPYISIDHLKMGLIRSGYTDLSPEDDAALTDYMWPIIREMIKTAIENNQNLIVEGCYIPVDWSKDFSDDYLTQIRLYCIVMTEKYIRKNFSNIQQFANVIESRISDDITIDSVIEDNARFLEMNNNKNTQLITIDTEYDIDINFKLIKKDNHVYCNSYIYKASGGS